MHRQSPWYLFVPTSIGWLHRRHAKGEPILREDVRRLVHADQRNCEDPILQHYILLAVDDELKPPRGRRPEGPRRGIKLLAARELVPERAAEIKAERKRSGHKHMRGDLEPSVQAANEIGHWLRLPVGRSLLNAISALES